jgi:hypothetical protein
MGRPKTSQILKAMLRQALMTNPHGWQLKTLVEIMLGEDQPYRNYFARINVVNWLMRHLHQWEEAGLVIREVTPIGTRWRWVETTGFECA